VQLGEGLHVS